MLIAVVIPVYNEREMAPVLLERVLAEPPPRMPDGTPCDRVLVVVDDGSTDGTADYVRSLQGREGIRALVHEKNQGKGAAVRTGFRAAVETRADVLIIQDADLEYDPADHGPLLAPVLDGRADCVIGTRFIGGTHRVLYYWHSVVNKSITTLCNMVTNLNLTDIECGLKAFTRPVAERITIQEDRFGVEPELVAKVARMRLTEPATGRSRRLRVYEVPVSYSGRTYEEGKKIGWRDGVRALWCIVKYGVIG